MSTNLLPAPVVRARAMSRRRGLWSCVSAVILVALGVVYGVLRVRAGPLDDVTGAITQVQNRIDDAKREAQEINKRVALQRGMLETARQVRNHPNFGDLLRVLARTRGPNVALTRARVQLRPSSPPGATPSVRPAAIDSRQYVLAMSGIADSQQAVAEYVLALEGLGLFKSVKRTATRARPAASPGAPSLVGFDLACEMHDEGGAK